MATLFQSYFPIPLGDFLYLKSKFSVFICCFLLGLFIPLLFSLSISLVCQLFPSYVLRCRSCYPLALDCWAFKAVHFRCSQYDRIFGFRCQSSCPLDVELNWNFFVLLPIICLGGKHSTCKSNKTIFLLFWKTFWFLLNVESFQNLT